MPDKIALVTGAYKGIGFEIARQLAKRGVHVVIGARHAAKAVKAAELIQKDGGKAEGLALDVDDEASIKAVAGTIKKKHGRLDILVNNAGIYPDKKNDISETDVELFVSAFRTNALGPVLTTQTFLPLLEEGHGRVINISSGLGALSGMTAGQAPAYSISKTALNAVTRQFAAALKPKDIPVNTMCPGWVKTDMGGPEAPRTPAQGADTAVWLALDAPADLTGLFFRDRKSIDWERNPGTSVVVRSN